MAPTRSKRLPRATPASSHHQLWEVSWLRGLDEGPQKEAPSSPRKVVTGCSLGGCQGWLVPVQPSVLTGEPTREGGGHRIKPQPSQKLCHRKAGCCCSSLFLSLSQQAPKNAKFDHPPLQSTPSIITESPPTLSTAGMRLQTPPTLRQKTTLHQQLFSATTGKPTRQSG